MLFKYVDRCNLHKQICEEITVYPHLIQTIWLKMYFFMPQKIKVDCYVIQVQVQELSCAPSGSRGSGLFGALGEIKHSNCFKLTTKHEKKAEKLWKLHAWAMPLNAL